MVCRNPFFFAQSKKVDAMDKTTKPNEPMKTKEREKTSRDPIIACRKRCDADGTGLSHYILMDKKAK